MSNEKICITLSVNPIKDPIFWNAMLDTFASVATIVAASLTGYAVYIALKQLRTSHSQNSIGLYQQYLQLCIQYPQFANGLLKPQQKNCQVYQQYLWFVATMLNCFEQVLISSSHDQQWVNTVGTQLKKHKKALASSGSLERDEWEPVLLNLIQKTLDE
ncbi:hypothetical protein [Aliivibrio fischeri]|uniref:hypothetical protein n=1 Tax=Aliivibrio fischeri TaxID=668 RepID=UPI001F44BB33|nr:hypothetical protein [Aliivibrio fischeri]MCE4934011.1 hypothetical protein [Aliivibrio fischeri]